MINFAYFGSSRLSIIVLNELLTLGYKPTLIVTTPDKPQGRKLTLTPNVVKDWAVTHNIPVLDPVKLDANFIEQLKPEKYPLFIVASYGKIIPQAIIDLPVHKTLNIHPSLLPQYRGASPLPTAILEDTKETGVSIMQLDHEMDHGPIVAQKKINVTDHFKEWPTYEDFEEFMAKQGARLLAEIMPSWVAGAVTPHEQDHTRATYTKKISKEDGLIDITDLQKNTPSERAYTAFRKVQAFHQWPQAYFFITHKGRDVRVKITEASFSQGKLHIQKVIPEGKKEMSYEDFSLGYGASIA